MVKTEAAETSWLLIINMGQYCLGSQHCIPGCSLPYVCRLVDRAHRTGTFWGWEQEWKPFPRLHISFRTCTDTRLLSIHNKVRELTTRKKIKTKQLQIQRFLCSHGCLVSVTGVCVLCISPRCLWVGSVTVTGHKPSADFFNILPFQYLRFSR